MCRGSVLPWDFTLAGLSFRIIRTVLQKWQILVCLCGVLGTHSYSTTLMHVLLTEVMGQVTCAPHLMDKGAKA